MNILIVDDHPFLKAGIIEKTSLVFPNAICYFVDNIKDALFKIRNNKIHLTIYDLEFKNDSSKDGFYLLEKTLELEPNSKCIALSSYNSNRIVNRAINKGFLSFLDKGCSFEDFENTLINVMKYGKKYESLSMKKVRESKQKKIYPIFEESLLGISNLSLRELELVLYTKETTNTKLLSKKMENTENTINSYFKKIYPKLNMNNRNEISFFSLEFHDELLKEKKNKLKN